MWENWYKSKVNCSMNPLAAAFQAFLYELITVEPWHEQGLICLVIVRLPPSAAASLISDVAAVLSGAPLSLPPIAALWSQGVEEATRDSPTLRVFHMQIRTRIELVWVETKQSEDFTQALQTLHGFDLLHKSSAVRDIKVMMASIDQTLCLLTDCRAVRFNSFKNQSDNRLLGDRVAVTGMGWAAKPNICTWIHIWRWNYVIKILMTIFSLIFSLLHPNITVLQPHSLL